ncbi:MAG: winged helix-turn-helix domain-containing protein [Pirellulales bacterium]
MCAKKRAPSPAAKKKPAGSVSPKSTTPKSTSSSSTSSNSTSLNSATSENNGDASSVVPTAAKKTVPVKSVATTTLKPAERTLSSHDIGLVAGEIWGALADKEPQTLAAIKKAVTAPPDVIAAAIGWLAREDKLEFTTSGRTLKIGLKA